MQSRTIGLLLTRESFYFKKKVDIITKNDYYVYINYNKGATMIMTRSRNRRAIPDMEVFDSEDGFMAFQLDEKLSNWGNYYLYSDYLEYREAMFYEELRDETMMVYEEYLEDTFEDYLVDGDPFYCEMSRYN